MFDNEYNYFQLLESVDDKIKLAKITNATDDELRDQQVMTAGWGMINDGSIPRYMMEVQLNMVSRKKCLQNIKAARKLPLPIVLEKNTFCTNGGSDYALLNCVCIIRKNHISFRQYNLYSFFTMIN